MTNVTGAVGRSTVVRVSADVTAARGERLFNAARGVSDSTPIVRAGPSGIVELEPLVMATEGGRTAFFASPSPSTVRGLVADFESEGLPKPEVEGYGEHYPTGGLIPTSDEQRARRHPQRRDGRRNEQARGL